MRSVTVKLLESLHDCSTLDCLAQIVRRHPGQIPLRMLLEMVDGRRVLLEADRDKVAWSQEFYRAITDLLGAGCLRAALTLGKGRSKENSRGSGGRSSVRTG